MLFGGIFKIWSGGKAKARRLGMLQQQSRTVRIDPPNQEGDDTENTTPGVPTSPDPVEGVLALDRAGTNTLDVGQDTDFTADKPGATSSFDGLKAFDTNNDGFLDAGDAQWQKFGIWNDADGSASFEPGEFQTFTSLGIVSVSLASLHDGYLYFQRANGTEGALALTP